MPLFSTYEYLQRLEKTKESMEMLGIDVLLITDPANMNYLSGYDGWSFYVHQTLVVLLEEEQPYWIGRAQDANGAKHTAFIDTSHIVPYPEDHIHSDARHPMDFVASFLKDKQKGNRRIGIEKDAYYFTAKCAERLESGLPDATFVDATLLVNRVRIVKSEQEIAYMRQAGVLVSQAMRVAMDSIAVGVRECDVAAKIYHAQISGTPQFGGDYPAIVPLMPRGEMTSAPHITWSDDRYREGDAVIVELAGCVRRYHSPLARTLVLSPTSPNVTDLAKVVVEGMESALAAVKPGVRLEEVEQAWRKVIERYGFQKESRLGYSMGLNYPPDWGEHTASIRRGDQTVLVPNMTFHMIPGMWLDDFGVEISESFRVTENGYELFADVERQLFIK
ncbi:M24 family metallopeptidase [Alicyclobacillus fastidiosus]|uniref:M24 family metallopeptidase n=1 Tax=Alicyclobacillus fastidiosus TaxID=392011 RepID=A0ABY6ZCF1_9BACL|nr:M24 family metallopeptidase [Alicyclobacillus fastidiosus]WAH39936.1 M24 family metallopeptidase [Alicyclobacillus fastidiosus]